MNKDICVVVNTTSKNSDVWKMFYTQIKKHFPQHAEIYTFSDIPNDEFIGQTFLYDKNLKFRSQFLSCIKKVPEDYCIFISEDYVLYDNVNINKIEFLQNILREDDTISFIKLFKGADFQEPLYKGIENLFELSLSNPYFFSQSATLWRTRDL